MTNKQTRIARIRYNLEFAGYEAVVFISENGTDYTYPSFVTAPLDAEYALVMRSLTEAAYRKHRSDNPGLRSYLRRLTNTPFAPTHPPLAA
ncbi:hypothetical protein KO498_14885 [Lentibacter algarum]|uniref:hypothetical protein n=1 Tax=Lentibacter algarum TaxID=576131 RepID=UPI001C09AA49|nr:hypothetical protein [Lentibacter algarum]MBU2983095.1 hypothetical protein [Lentibacter algarum]